MRISSHFCVGMLHRYGTYVESSKLTSVRDC